MLFPKSVKLTTKTKEKNVGESSKSEAMIQSNALHQYDSPRPKLNITITFQLI